MMKTKVQEIKRVGIVSADPLRVVGLQAILEDRPLANGSRLQVVPMSAPHALRTPGLEVVVIDAGAAEYLFALIEGFRRDRPKLRLLVLGSESDQGHVEMVIAAGARGYLHHSASEVEI